MGGVDIELNIEGDELVLPLDGDGMVNRPLERKYWNGITWALR
jgi:hypothetical protein